MTLWLDVEDLFFFVETGHRRPTGIQRLTLEIYRALQEIDPNGERVRFVRHSARNLFTHVDWSEIDGQFSPQAETEPGRAHGSSKAQLIARRPLSRLPDDIQKHLVAGTILQLQSVGELARFGFNLLRRPKRRPGFPASTNGSLFADLARPGDTLLVLGSPWFRADYGVIARWLRDERRMRFGVFLHDLVPVRRPEWTDRGVQRVFEQWYGAVLPFCDVLFANSRHTAADLEAYAHEKGIPLPGPVQPVPIGTGFPCPATAAPLRPTLPSPGSYVLFVSTLEARKNHTLLFRIWSMLLADIRAGRRAPETVPDLVFAGGIGWLVGDLMQQLENTGWLGGCIRHIQHPTDAELRALYGGCLFTVFPSFGEGWGLPVTESLAFGKPCLASSAAALPEAGRDLCRYFDPEDLTGAYAAICAVLDDRPGLQAWEERVRREFRPTPWSDTARSVLDAVARLDV